MVEESRTLEIKKEGDSYHIIFNGLLPGRFKGKTSGELYLYKQNIFNTYYPFFDRYFRDNPADKFRKKVEIKIIHHFRTAEEVKDPDNFEIKQILDFISSYLLYGDSLMHCCLVIDGVMDQKTFSEIYIYEASHD